MRHCPATMLAAIWRLRGFNARDTVAFKQTGMIDAT
jgi:hypothetical protein